MLIILLLLMCLSLNVMAINETSAKSKITLIQMQTEINDLKQEIVEIRKVNLLIYFLSPLLSGIIGVLISLVVQRIFQIDMYKESRRKEHLKTQQDSLKKFIENKYIFYNEDTDMASEWYRDIKFHFPVFTDLVKRYLNMTKNKFELVELGYQEIAKEAEKLSKDKEYRVQIRICQPLKEEVISAPSWTGWKLKKFYESGKVCGITGLESYIELTSGNDLIEFKEEIDKLCDFIQNWRQKDDTAIKIAKINMELNELERNLNDESFRITNIQYLPKDCEFIKA